MLALLSAELYALGRSKFLEALAEYNRAISFSARCGFRMFTGIPYERRGVYLLGNGFVDKGTESLQQACIEFCSFGAKAQTKQMMQKYKVMMRFNQDAKDQDSKSSTRFQPFLFKRDKREKPSDDRQT